MLESSEAHLDTYGHKSLGPAYKCTHRTCLDGHTWQCIDSIRVARNRDGSAEMVELKEG